MRDHGVNVELLQRVLDHITTHPEEHDQTWWAVRDRCGATYCMAGHTVVMAGHRIDWDSTDWPACLPDGFFTTAARELGLSTYVAGRFFLDAVTIDDLWDLAEEISDGEVHRTKNSFPAVSIGAELANVC